MRRKSFEEMNCSIAQTLEVVGEWWTMLILRDCFLGVRRFDDFQQRLGISRNILTERLDHLVERGVLKKVPYQERPVRNEYRLTDKGRDLWPVLTAIRQWGDKWEMDGLPPVVVVHKDCGHETTAIFTCSECGEPLQGRSIRAIAGPGASADSPFQPVASATPTADG